MKDRIETLSRILDCGIIAIIRAPDVEQGYNLAEAAHRGGIIAIEIAMTTPGALEVIRGLAGKYPGGEVIIGAGTVLDPETARLTILSGAEYVVSPHFNLEIIRMCHRYCTVCMPGAMSIKEVIEVLESGADAIKIFPASLFGPEIIRAIKGPLPQVRLIPTGGVNLGNVAKWFEAGAAAVGVGGELTKEALAMGNYSLMEQRARDFVTRIKEIRKKLRRGE
jgi:2-dehydro-3-deoxyphosphogluconate aldolase/(4S)-4-hydroxy-2-oxoglutarate aldolase